MAELIQGELNKPGSEFDSPDEPVIFFSAHGVPVSYVEDAGDPYKAWSSPFFFHKLALSN
jgi:ferrochelatase